MSNTARPPRGEVNLCGFWVRDRLGELFYHTRDIAEGVSAPALSPFLALSQRLGAFVMMQPPPQSVDNRQGRMRLAAASSGSQP